jgi:hypothetical protein
MLKLKYLLIAILAYTINLNSYKIDPQKKYTTDISYLDLFKDHRFLEVNKRLKEEGTHNLIYEDFNLSILHYAVTLDADEINYHMEKCKNSTPFNVDNFETLILLMLINGADYTIQTNFNGHTAIHEAIARNNYWAIKVFCQCCNLNILNRDGDTPLHLAIKLGNYEFVKMLVKAGADYSIQNNEDLSALKLAENFCIKEIKPPQELFNELLDESSDESYYYESDSYESFDEESSSDKVAKILTKKLTQTLSKKLYKTLDNVPKETREKIFKFIKYFKIFKISEKIMANLEKYELNEELIINKFKHLKL